MLFGRGSSTGTYIRMLNYDGPGLANASCVDDSYVRELRDKMFEAFYLGDEEEVNRIHREEVLPYVLEQAWVIPSPSERYNTFWWPWLKNYSGELSLGNSNPRLWAKNIWIDQELKKSMGY